MKVEHLSAFNFASTDLDPSLFLETAASRLAAGGRAVSYFAVPDRAGHRLVLALAFDREGRLEVYSTLFEGPFRALTPSFPQLHLFEREIYEQSGLKPEGHPWLKPIRFNGQGAVPGLADYFTVHGSQVHEVAVGPVHAGVIEPGHFRFQCHGERVFHLEIMLGYQHRGLERKFIGGPDGRSLHYAETLAGDTTIGHAWAYCGAVEALAAVNAPPRAQALRGIMLELERLASHTGDLGALAGDVAFLPTASFCGRLRGELLNMTALVCGNRFGRNMLKPGGVNFDLDFALAKELKLRLENTYRDVENAVSLLWETGSVTDRFEGTGVVPKEVAEGLGLVGPAARASGVGLDTRRNFPAGPYEGFTLGVSGSGDVYSRAYVRWLEIQKSAELVGGWLDALPEGPVAADCGALKPESAAVSLVEGWRGQICHVALTGRDGKFRHYKITDPSFQNWQALAMALRNGEISDFPLCNKSFNLSYCGRDL
ncbi:MAG TPA: hydrogenase [Elusimicrobia bacterium]|nr:MAG: hydrogenase [Elusimicrobia bacterium GWD2_63_28]HCC47097.1 hydrogenase [Elusimicrobiota bacterium]